MSDWTDDMTSNLDDPLVNIERACTAMLDRLAAGTYRTERAHIEADLSYLRAETRRAMRHRTHAINASLDHFEAGARDVVARTAESDVCGIAFGDGYTCDLPGGHS